MPSWIENRCSKWPNFWARQPGVKERRNLTSVLSFFLLLYVQTNTKNGKTKNDFCFIVLWTRKHRNGKTKIDFRFIFLRFLYAQTQKTEKWQMTSLLPFFFLCTKTHKNIQMEIDFRSIVFRCKYDQSVKERTGYNLIFRLSFFSFSLAV